jgi:hypothetical protein
MGSRIFLGLSALMWLPYGLLCLARPSFLEGTAGVTAINATAPSWEPCTAVCRSPSVCPALGCRSTAWRSTALTTVGMLTAGLGLGRLAGVVAGGGVSSYTAAALAIEFVSAALAFTFARTSE